MVQGRCALGGGQLPCCIESRELCGTFWPAEKISRLPTAGVEGLNARQRNQVYQTHSSHFSAGHSLNAPSGKAAPSVYDPGHQQRLLEAVQVAHAALGTRSLPSEACLPNPKDMRLTVNAGHGVVLPSPESLQPSKIAHSDTRIRRTQTADQLKKPCPDAESNSSSKENRNCAPVNVDDNQLQAGGSEARCFLRSPSRDTEALRVISAAPRDGAIPAEFQSLSSNLQLWDCRAELCSSPRKFQRSPRSASERKILNLSESERFDGLFSKSDHRFTSLQSPRDKDSWQDAMLAKWCKPPQCSSKSFGEAPVASYTELLDACRKGDEPKISEPDTPTATQRKSVGLEVSPSSPFATPRKPSGRPTGDMRRSQSLCESPRRRSERNYSDVFGRESLPRPSSRSSRSKFADSATASQLDTRVELSTLRSPRGRESPRRRTERNYSDLFDTSMPERQRNRSHSPDQLMREEERSCFDSRITYEMNAELCRRLKEAVLERNGALSPRKDQESLSASERKRLDLASGNLRLCTGGSSRVWDDGRLGPGPAPQAPTMRMRSRPDSARFRQQHGSPARDRYVRSVLTSNIF